MIIGLIIGMVGGFLAGAIAVANSWVKREKKIERMALDGNLPREVLVELLKTLRRYEPEVPDD